MHESTVDSRPQERSLCDVDGGGVVLEDVREDVVPRREVLIVMFSLMCVGPRIFPSFL